MRVPAAMRGQRTAQARDENTSNTGASVLPRLCVQSAGESIHQMLRAGRVLAVRPLRSCACDQACSWAAVMSPNTLRQAARLQGVRTTGEAGVSMAPPPGRLPADKAMQAWRSAADREPLRSLSSTNSPCTAAPAAWPVQACPVRVRGQICGALPGVSLTQPLTTSAALEGAAAAAPMRGSQRFSCISARALWRCACAWTCTICGLCDTSRASQAVSDQFPDAEASAPACSGRRAHCQRGAGSVLGQACCSAVSANGSVIEGVSGSSESGGASRVWSSWASALASAAWVARRASCARPRLWLLA